MPLSRNQFKSAENLRCQRNLLMYFQLTRSVLRYLTVKITNKFVGINTPRMCPRLHSVSDGAHYRLRPPPPPAERWYAFRIAPRNNRVCVGSRHSFNCSLDQGDEFGARWRLYSLRQYTEIVWPIMRNCKFLNVFLRLCLKICVCGMVCTGTGIC